MFMKKRKSRKSKIVQGLTLLFTIVFSMLSMFTVPMTGYAVGDLDDIVEDYGDVDLTAYTFDELVAKGVTFPANFESLLTKDTNDIAKIKRAVYYNCKSAQEYYKWLDNAAKYIENSATGSGASLVYTFKTTPKGYKAGSENGGFSGEQAETEAWAQYNTYSNKLTKIMARGQGDAMVGDVFGQEFDPTNAVTLAAMNTFTMVCNSIFNFVSKALMLLFLVQTGFDVLYLVIPALQPILAPANANSGGGGAGLAQGKKFSMRFNVVSNEAVEANNRSATGSVGSNGGTGGGIFQTNIALRYLTARAPLIIIAFTYFVLVATNVWTDIISACTAFITGIFYGL